MDRFHEAGITVIPVVPSVALAKRMEKLGADALIAEGMEAGGHIGKLTTMTLVRQVVEAVSIPVIGAGGVADGAGAAAVFMLGAEAVQVGTRFVVAKESNASAFGPISPAIISSTPKLIRFFTTLSPAPVASSFASFSMIS